ncbi:unnamed protein product [Amoebophrya sp. A25]|nr:unnamed protein product [Amoebophrya sp. A25]|eukprot:GSA25T00006857001.1
MVLSSKTVLKIVALGGLNEVATGRQTTLRGSSGDLNCDTFNIGAVSNWIPKALSLDSICTDAMNVNKANKKAVIEGLSKNDKKDFLTRMKQAIKKQKKAETKEEGEHEQAMVLKDVRDSGVAKVCCLEVPTGPGIDGPAGSSSCC